jgi:hypothetical protein
MVGIPVNMALRAELESFSELVTHLKKKIAMK